MPLEDVRAFLTGESPQLARIRRRHQRFPSSPRCKMCSVPFAGPGGLVMKHLGFGRWAANPAICEQCIRQFRKHGMTGVELPVTLLFSDVRGSTSIGERLRPTEFRAFLDRFYRLAFDAILEHEGLVDKIVGDEVIGLFFGGVSGPDHAGAAIRAALDLAERASKPDATPMGPIPIGTAVHTGEAFVGATGPQGAADDFTALGDPVNATARLASAAAAGEVLVSLDALRAAGIEPLDREVRTLEIRGREATLDVAVLRRAVAQEEVSPVGAAP